MDENTPPDFLKGPDNIWSKKYVSANHDLQQFKLMWETLHEVHTFPNYTGQSFSPWENVEEVVMNAYLDVLSQYKVTTPQERINVHSRFGSALIVYLGRCMHNAQTDSLEQHLATFPYDEVYKKKFFLTQNEE